MIYNLMMSYGSDDWMDYFDVAQYIDYQYLFEYDY